MTDAKSVRLDDELIEEINYLAQLEQRTFSQMLRVILREGVLSYRRKHAG